MDPAPFSASLLQLAYVCDIIVSIPIVLIPLAGNETASQWLLGEKLPASQSMRILLGSLWLAIVSCLIAGVAFPLAMAPILILQLIYKSLWLIFFAVPRWLSGRGEEVSRKLVFIFLIYIVIYPWIIPWNAIFSTSRYAF